MVIKKSVLVLCTIFVFSDAAFVDTLNKCGIKDAECHKTLFQIVLKEGSKNGIPELDIAPFDPVVLKDVTLPILTVAELKIVDGTVKGLKNCAINSFDPQVEKGRALLDITCDLTFKGHYKAFSDSPVVKSVFGADSVHGDGNTKVKIEKLNLKFDFHFSIEKRDGETYIKLKDDKFTYKFDVLGKVAVAADNLYLGEQEASERITKMINQNWRLIVNSIGSPLMDRAVDRIKIILRNFFDNVPTKHFIIDDLTAYVK